MGLTSTEKSQKPSTDTLWGIYNFRIIESANQGRDGLIPEVFLNNNNLTYNENEFRKTKCFLKLCPNEDAIVVADLEEMARKVLGNNQE